MSSSPTETHEHGTDAGVAQVTMPKMGISVSEGTILEWRKAVGEEIAADETIADVTTDKVDVEIPCPATGTIAKLLAEPGDTVPVGTVIAEVALGAAQSAAVDAGVVAADDAPDAGAPGVVAADDAPEAGACDFRPDSPASRPPPSDAPSAEPPRRETNDSQTGAARAGFYSPVVRRVAEKHGVDLTAVEGTGIGGRVRKTDVLAFIAARDAGNGASARPAPMLHSESPYRPEPAPTASAAPAGPLGAATDAGDVRREMTPMRAAIARHMVESRRTSAHCTTIVEVDMSRVAAERAAAREAMARRGVKLTYLAYVCHAAVAALARHPQLNASVDGDTIVEHGDVNLGIAVALEDGLIVPVIPRAQRLSVEGLAAAIADVAERARAKRLSPDEVQGGTFTVTNPGQFGAVLATPIINQPQVAILDLEAIVKRPVVVEGPEGDSIAIRPMTYLCMSWDHRALDGADAARYLGDVKLTLEREGAQR